MLIGLSEQLPHLIPGEVYEAPDLVGPGLWALLRHAEPQRMGRCIRSYSRDAESRLRLLLRPDGSVTSPRRYLLT